MGSLTRAITSPGEQSATFVELFFDLVFVFGITQVVALLHHDLSPAGAGHSLLVFWLLWWAWTQFTWALNAADTTHPLVELATLVATAVAFFMSVAIPTAFEGGGLWFAVPYVGVRLLGLWLYAKVARANPAQHAAVRLFATASLGGLAAVLVGGFAGGTTQVAVWGLAILLDVVAAGIAGNAQDWNIHAEHFAERHGLIVIIALGESLIVAAAGLSGGSFTTPLIVVALLGVLTSCALWWTYFPVAKPELERALASAEPAARGAMARDVFSLAHFPMLCGVIGFAAALEEAIAHPVDPLPLAGRAALALGLLLFTGGTALAMWWATCGRPILRVSVVLVTSAAILSFGSWPAFVSLGIALAGVALIAASDEVRAGRLRV